MARSDDGARRPDPRAGGPNPASMIRRDGFEPRFMQRSGSAYTNDLPPDQPSPLPDPAELGFNPTSVAGVMRALQGDLSFAQAGEGGWARDRQGRARPRSPMPDLTLSTLRKDNWVELAGAQKVTRASREIRR